MEQPKLIKSEMYDDHRGRFAPLQLHYTHRGELDKDWLQSNISVNPNKWTLRGLHYQSEPYAQTKLVKVITGSIFDFVVDLRKDSEDYGKCFIFEVTPNNEVYVPKGFAHGFITTEDNTVVQYLVDDLYSQPSEGSILWSSVPAIVECLNNVIQDFNPEDILISDKDKVCQTIEEYLNNENE